MFKSIFDNMQTALTWDDVTLVPQYTTIKSRKEPDTSTKLGGLTYKVPIISSCMNTVTEWEMAATMHELGAAAIVHRYMSIQQALDQAKKIFEKGTNETYFAVGASGDYLERAQALFEYGCRYVCVDVASAYNQTCLDAIKNIRNSCGSSLNIMAGCICDYHGAYSLADVGCDVIRSGIGGGVLCKTRTITGHGLPMLTTIEDSVRIKDKFPDVSIVCDGSIRNSGDLLKAIAIGADAAIVGNLLAGTEESPGSTFKDEQGNLYKNFFGMASPEGRASWFDKESTGFVPEGVAIKVPFKGSAKKVIENLVGGLKTGMTFSDARSLKELRENAQWIRVTTNGMREALPATKK